MICWGNLPNAIKCSVRASTPTPNSNSTNLGIKDPALTQTIEISKVSMVPSLSKQRAKIASRML
jgi:hypothetical protein